MKHVIKTLGTALNVTKAEREVRRSIRHLKSMNDRELRDLGIDRSSIEQVVRHGNQT